LYDLFLSFGGRVLNLADYFTLRKLERLHAPPPSITWCNRSGMVLLRLCLVWFTMLPLWSKKLKIHIRYPYQVSIILLTPAVQQCQIFINCFCTPVQTAFKASGLHLKGDVVTLWLYWI